MPDVLFLSASANHSRIYLAVHREMTSSAGFAAIPFLGTRSESPLQAAGLSYHRWSGPNPLAFTPLRSALAVQRGGRREAARLLDAARPKVLVVANDASHILTSAVRVAAARGIGTVLIQEGLKAHRQPWYRFRFTGPHLRGWPIDIVSERLRPLGLDYGSSARTYGRTGCDRICVSSAVFRDMLTSYGVPDERVRVTGFPLYAEWCESLARAPEAEALSATVAEALSEPFVLFVHQSFGIPLEREVALYRRMASICDDLGHRLIIKLHPMTRRSPEAWTERVRSAGGGACPIFLADAPNGRLLREARVVVGAFSSMAAEALILGATVALIRFLPTAFRISLGDAALHIDREEDLEAELARAVTDDALRSSLASQIPASLEALFHATDGRAAHRTAAVIDQLVEEKRST